jgi:hypothetical protein
VDEDSEEGEGGQDKAPSDGLLKKLDAVYEEAVIDRFKKKLETEIKKEKSQLALHPPISKSTVEQNDTIIKEGGSINTEDYLKALGLSIRTANSEQEAVFNIALVNNHFGVNVPSSVYKVASKIGNAENYSSVEDFLKKASEVYGKTLSEKESFALIRISKLLSLNSFGQR